MDFIQVGELSKGLGVAEGNVDDSVVGEGGHGRDGGRLLSSAVPRSRHEDAAKLAPKTSRRPEAAGGVDESLQTASQRNISITWTGDDGTHFPLRGEVTVTSGDTEEEGIELAKVLGMKDGIVGLRGRIHLGQDFLREGLLNPDDQNIIRDRSLWLEGNHAYW